MPSDFETEVLSSLGDIKASAAATAERVRGLDERLFNGEGVIPAIHEDIVELKTRMDDKDKWDRIKVWVAGIAAPFLALVHALLNYLGVHI